MPGIATGPEDGRVNYTQALPSRSFQSVTEIDQWTIQQTCTKLHCLLEKQHGKVSTLLEHIHPLLGSDNKEVNKKNNELITAVINSLVRATLQGTMRMDSSSTLRGQKSPLYGSKHFSSKVGISLAHEEEVVGEF